MSNDHSPTFWIKKFFEKDVGAFKAIAIYAVAISVLSLAVPITVQSLVNSVAFTNLLQPLFTLMVIFLLTEGAMVIFQSIQYYAVEIFQRKFFVRTAGELSESLSRARVSDIRAHQGSEVVNRFLDVVTIQKSAAYLMTEGLSLALQILVGFVLLAFYHPILLAFDVVLGFALYFIVFRMGRDALKTAMDESKAKYVTVAWLEQVVDRPIVLRSPEGDEFREKKTLKIINDYLSYRTKHFKHWYAQVNAALAVKVLASAALLGVGGFLVMKKQLTLGQLVAAELVMTAVLNGFAKLGKQLEAWYDLVAGSHKLSQVYSLVGEQERFDDRAIPELIDAPFHSLAISEVTVFNQKKEKIIDRFSLAIKPGETWIVHGQKGSGKSTLTDVIYGFTEPHEGKLFLSGIDSIEIPKKIWRSSVTLVRDHEFFAGTLIDNLSLGKLSTSMDQDRALQSVIEIVGMKPTVDQLKDGVFTKIGSDGRPMSSSQANALVLARALLSRPKVLLIDQLFDTESFDRVVELSKKMRNFYPEMAQVWLTSRDDFLGLSAQKTTLEVKS